MTTTDTIETRPDVLYLGNPVLFVTTRSPEGQVNLAPFSSMWTLGDTMVLGVSCGSRTGMNLAAGGDVVVNVAGESLWPAAEAMAESTGLHPDLDTRAVRPDYDPDKFATTGLTEVPSLDVDVPRIAECPMQIEGRVLRETRAQAGHFWIVEAKVLHVHVHSELVDPETARFLPEQWRPLLYTFRHYRAASRTLAVSKRARLAAQSRSSANTVSGSSDRDQLRSHSQMTRAGMPRRA
ncbi:flavin reductase family protein [Cellulomonas sp. NPDC089187]|uniref:flavin reductase family protein n=1 Tax=Cellulomonas sp. NPDC089187 TaxID=3154970 RepID=UPI0034283CEC